MTSPDHTQLMGDALALARVARDAGDHPYGAAIITDAGTIVERNRVVTTSDPTAHSELTAIRKAAATWGTLSLSGSVLITTFEPCPMCLGAIVEAGVTTVVIGARRTVGEPPLGDYTVEALLALMGRSGDIAVSTGPRAAEVSAFYAEVG